MGTDVGQPLGGDVGGADHRFSLALTCSGTRLNLVTVFGRSCLPKETAAHARVSEALEGMNRVATHINEMQRVTDTFSVEMADSMEGYQLGLHMSMERVLFSSCREPWLLLVVGSFWYHSNPFSCGADTFVDEYIGQATATWMIPSDDPKSPLGHQVRCCDVDSASLACSLSCCAPFVHLLTGNLLDFL